MIFKHIDSSWYTDNTSFVNGYILHDNMHYIGKQLIDVFKKNILSKNLEKFLNSITGKFAAVIQINGNTYIISDIIKSYGLYYKIKNGELLISDEISQLFDENTEIDKSSEIELRKLGYISNSQTLYCNIYQTEASSFIKYSFNEISFKHYANFYISQTVKNLSFEQILERFESIYIEVFKRCIKYLDNKQVVIPLSDGLDSRIILYFLKKLDYKNIITFTYGDKDSKSVSISKEISEIYNVKWFMVDYSKKEMGKLFNNDYKNLSGYYGYGICVPIIQDWYAINWLLKNNIIDKNSVIIPGHAFTSVYEFSIDNSVKNDLTISKLSQSIFKKNYVYSTHLVSKDSYFLSKIESKLKLILLENQKSNSEINYINLLLYYLLIERQSKLIANSIKTYKYYEIDYYLPLYDKEIIDFWLSLDYSLTLDRCLYKKIVDHLTKDFQNVSSSNTHTNRYRFLKERFKRLHMIYSSFKRRINFEMHLDYYMTSYKFIFQLILGHYKYVDMWIDYYLKYSKNALK